MVKMTKLENDALCFHKFRDIRIMKNEQITSCPIKSNGLGLVDIFVYFPTSQADVLLR